MNKSEPHPVAQQSKQTKKSQQKLNAVAPVKLHSSLPKAMPTIKLQKIKLK